VKEYMELILDERKRSTIFNTEEPEKKTDEDGKGNNS
jgi:hypothetical protein